jgi:hypothetical protein
VLLTAALGAAGASRAAFTYSSESTVEASVDRIGNWLHLYSQGSDPDGETGYATQVANPGPAATREDEGIAVLFVIPNNGTHTHARVVKVRTPDAFPDVSPDPAIGAVNVTVTVTPDPGTGQQPISRYGVDAWNAAPTYTRTIAGWDPAMQRQLNLQTKFPGKKFGPGIYEPSVVLTLTFTGMTVTFYQYTIPVTIEYM